MSDEEETKKFGLIQSLKKLAGSIINDPLEFIKQEGLLPILQCYTREQLLEMIDKVHPPVNIRSSPNPYSPVNTMETSTQHYSHSQEKSTMNSTQPSKRNLNSTQPSKRNHKPLYMHALLRASSIRELNLSDQINIDFDQLKQMLDKFEKYIISEEVVQGQGIGAIQMNATNLIFISIELKNVPVTLTKVTFIGKIKTELQNATTATFKIVVKTNYDENYFKYFNTLDKKGN